MHLFRPLDVQMSQNEGHLGQAKTLALLQHLAADLRLVEQGTKSLSMRTTELSKLVSSLPSSFTAKSNVVSVFLASLIAVLTTNAASPRPC